MSSTALSAPHSISATLLTDDYPFFPRPAQHIPFGELLNSLFFDPIKDNLDYPIHGPNVIRLCRALLDGALHEPGLVKGDLPSAHLKYNNYAHSIQDALGVTSAPDPVHEMAK